MSRWAWLVSMLGIAGAACDSSGPPRIAGTGGTGGIGGTGGACFIQPLACTCPDGDGIQDHDSCTGMPVGECGCPRVESCVSARLACRSRRTCDARGTCGACERCAVPVATGEGGPRALALAPDGVPHVLVDRAPWLYAVRDGAATPVAGVGGLGWARAILFDVDGSLIVAGSTGTGATSAATVQRLDLAGPRVIGSLDWHLDVENVVGTSETTTFGALAMRADGAVVLVASAGAVLGVQILTAATQVGGGTTMNLASASADKRMRRATSAAFSPSGELFVAGDLGTLNTWDVWLVRLSPSFGYGRELITTTTNQTSSGYAAVSVSGANEVYFSWSRLFTTWEAGLGRVDGALQPVWDRRLDDPLGAIIVAGNVLLPDSIVYYGRTSGAIVGRRSKTATGSLTEEPVMEPAGGVFASAAVLADPWTVYLLSSNDGSFQLTRAQFDPLP